MAALANDVRHESPGNAKEYLTKMNSRSGTRVVAQSFGNVNQLLSPLEALGHFFEIVRETSLGSAGNITPG